MQKKNIKIFNTYYVLYERSILYTPGLKLVKNEEIEFYWPEDSHNQFTYAGMVKEISSNLFFFLHITYIYVHF